MNETTNGNETMNKEKTNKRMNEWSIWWLNEEILLHEKQVIRGISPRFSLMFLDVFIINNNFILVLPPGMSQPRKESELVISQVSNVLLV